MKPKISLKKINNDHLNSLKEKYFIRELYLIDKDSMILIMKFNEINKLMENHAKLFDNLTSSISMYMENYLEDDFKRWNVYILYIFEVSIEKEIKYKIENDTFFARKIVEDEYSSQLTDKNIEELISKHIDFDHFTLNMHKPKNEAYQSNSEIYLKLKNINTISESQIDEILKLLEGTKDEI